MVEMADAPINLTFDHLHDEEEDQTYDLDEEEEDDLDDEEEDEALDLDDEEYKLENFRKEMPINTSFERPMSKYRLWAFWSEPTPLSRCRSGDSVTQTSNTNQGIITEKIKSALLHFNNIFQQGDVLIQFWAPMRTETGCLELVTSDQPFALTKHLDERLLKYRKHCLEYKFNVDGSQQYLGIPGRVFRQKWHECISDVRDYTSKEYPQRNFALSCDISASFAFPVFQTSFQDCVGVIEFVTNTDSTTLDIMCYSFLQDVLKTAGLKSSLSYLLISRIHEEHLNEICEGVKVVCTTHRLPLAHTSVPYNSSDMFDVNSIVHLQWPKSYVGNQKQNKDSAKPPEAPKDYIHVRARSVQATDSHSLADRVRREKIRERMKLLQDLVPGCNKVTRKVVLLDEVINNTQSLQRQVEFLSYKLATINPRMDINIEAILSKDICQSRGAMPHNIYPSDTSATAFPCGYQSQQGPQLHSGISNGTETPFSMNPLNAPLRRNPSTQLPPIDGFGDIASQSTCTKNYDYILDSFPNRENTYGEDPSTVWRSLLERMKQHFPIFKNASGEEFRKELSIEFFKPRTNQEFASLQCQNTKSPSGPTVLHNGQEMMQPHSLNQQLIVGVDDINNGWNVVSEGQNSILVSCSDESFMNQEFASFQCQSTKSPSVLPVLHNGQEMMQPHSSNQQLMLGVDDINNGRNVVNAERNNMLVSCSDEICMNQELASFQCQSSKSPSGFAVLHNEQEMMQLHSSNQQLIVGVNDINNGRNVVNAEQNSILVSCSDETCMNVPASFQCQSTISSPGPGILHNGQETMQPHLSNHQLMVEVDDISNGRTERNNTQVSYLDEANSITYVELKKHFGKKIEDVAEIFGVSRSTIKRKCRENGISRWPQGKRNKINNSPSGQDPPCSAKKFLATVPQKTLLVTPPTPPQLRTITIKATCGDDVLKFQLPSTSTMVELEEEVSKRLKYVGTYKVRYTDNDGDQVLIACDKDLENCMSASNSLGMNRVEIFILPITKISPST